MKGEYSLLNIDYITVFIENLKSDPEVNSDLSLVEDVARVRSEYQRDLEMLRARYEKKFKLVFKKHTGRDLNLV